MSLFSVIRPIVDELWRLNDEWAHFRDWRDLERISLRQQELVSLLPTAEGKLWTALGLCDELYQVNTLITPGAAKALVAFFSLLPEKACTWPEYPFGSDEPVGELHPLPPLDDPYCPLWHDGFQRGYWQGTAFFPGTVKLADLVSVFEEEPSLCSSWTGDGRDDFSAWVRSIVQVLQFVPWIGFEIGEESGSLVTFWSPDSDPLLGRILIGLHEKDVQYGVARIEGEGLTWTEYGD